MNEESLFIKALQRPTVAERRAFLEKACAGDVALQRRVERLLAAHWEAIGILDRPLRPCDSVEEHLPSGDDCPRVCIKRSWGTVLVASGVCLLLLCGIVAVILWLPGLR
jgi:hypothetical protein